MDQCEVMEVCWLLRVRRGHGINSLGLKLYPKHKPEKLEMISEVLTKLLPKITWKIEKKNIQAYLYYLNNKKKKGEMGQKGRRKTQSYCEIELLERNCVCRD